MPFANNCARGFVPILFDFDKPTSRDFTETVSTLAHLSRFVIADITDPKCVPHELQAIIPTLAVPIVTVIESGNDPYGMFLDHRKYSWVLPTHVYTSPTDLIASLDETVISRGEALAQELIETKTARY